MLSGEEKNNFDKTLTESVCLLKSRDTLSHCRTLCAVELACKISDSSPTADAQQTDLIKVVVCFLQLSGRKH